MKAAVYRGDGKLAVEEVVEPRRAPGEVLVKVAACGVCRTDLHYLHGVPTFKKPPLILGHEISGTVKEAPEGALQVGQRVLVPPVFPCGVCEYCRQGRETLCRNMVMLGNHRDGGFAEYVTVPDNAVFPLPETVPLAEGCIISDAFSTPYHAVVNRALVKPGEVVAVFGCGGVGLATVQLVALAGAKPIAVDLIPQKLELASKFGAWKTVDASSVDPVKEVRRVSGGGADAALEVIGNPLTIQQAFNSLKWGGRLVVVGYTEGDLTLSGAKLMFREMEVRGSLGCGLHDFPKVIDLAARGLIDVGAMVSHKYPLKEIETPFRMFESSDPTLLRAIVIP